jgi:phosphatidylglycerophosphate synthase
LLFQLNSIIDGVDGELARMRLEASVLGEWLDTVGDGLCNTTSRRQLAGARQPAFIRWLK